MLAQRVEAREMVRLLETTTRVESEFHVEVFPRTNGVLTALYFDEGDRVQAGQVLAKIDDRDAMHSVNQAAAALEEAEARLPELRLAAEEAASRLAGLLLSAEQAKRDYERNLAIAQGGSDRPGLISQTELEAKRLAWDTAQSAHETAKLALQRAQVEEKAGPTTVARARSSLDAAKLQLSYTEIVAPFDGVVAERFCNVGDTCGRPFESSGTRSEAAFTITDPDHLRAIFYRPQRELPLFRVDAPPNGSGGSAASAELEIQVTAEALPGRAYRGVIERIAPTIDPRSGNFRVTARLDPLPVTPAEQDAGEDPPPSAHAADRLLAGMLVRLAIVIERRPGALVVHKRAIQREGDLSLVYVVRDGKAVRVIVEEGLSDDERVEILAREGAGIAAGDVVVIVGQRDLEDGADVEVTFLDANASPEVLETLPAPAKE